MESPHLVLPMQITQLPGDALCPTPCFLRSPWYNGNYPVWFLRPYWGEYLLFCCVLFCLNHWQTHRWIERPEMATRPPKRVKVSSLDSCVVCSQSRLAQAAWVGFPETLGLHLSAQLSLPAKTQPQGKSMVCPQDGVCATKRVQSPG
jgi:hypothetical protein